MTPGSRPAALPTSLTLAIVLLTVMVSTALFGLYVHPAYASAGFRPSQAHGALRHGDP